MTNDETKVEETQDDEIEIDLNDDTTDASTDWKAKYDELAGKVGGVQKRFKTKIEKLKAQMTEPKKDSEASTSEPEKKDFDRADKALLIASGIKTDEYSLVKQWRESTGKELDDILESKHFQQELADLREEKAKDDATPSGSKRVNNASRDSVDYWLKKGELPPVDQVDLRRKVVKAKIARETQSKFSDTPVA